MKIMSICAGALFIAFAALVVTSAETVNPASNVTGDSANTARTTVYRDVNGSFAAGAIDVALKSETIAQLQAEVPASVGVVRYCNNCSPVKVVVATGTAAGNWADAVGSTFK